MKFKYAEGATPLDANEAAGLIPSLTTQKELNEWEQKNITSALIKHFGKKYTIQTILDILFLKSIHEDMFINTWKWAGKFRLTLKNIGVVPSQIQTDLRKLLDDVSYWIINETFPKDEICARFHVRLVSIHLFSNGNGRHARIVTDMLAESIDIVPFTWGAKDLYNEGETRRKYLEALKDADKNSYDLLLQFVRRNLQIVYLCSLFDIFYPLHYLLHHFQLLYRMVLASELEDY